MAVMRSYPSKCCWECAKAARGECMPGLAQNAERGSCDLCRKTVIVAPPSFFNWPSFPNCSPPTGQKRWQS